MWGVRLYVEGRNALFTRPESKAERVSYDVPTPSAMRGVLEAIHWKPAILWVVDKIHVLKPIAFENVRRNEVSQKGPAVPRIKAAAKDGTPLFLSAEACRQQRAALVLKDVAYVIEAHFELTDKAGPTDTPGKHLAIFKDRARTGACFQQPCLGCREFPAAFRLLEDGEPAPLSALVNDAPRDLGIMLYDIDFENDMRPILYRPRLVRGVINVARDKEGSLCHHI